MIKSADFYWPSLFARPFVPATEDEELGPVTIHYDQPIGYALHMVGGEDHEEAITHHDELVVIKPTDMRERIAKAVVASEKLSADDATLLLAAARDERPIATIDAVNRLAKAITRWTEVESRAFLWKVIADNEQEIAWAEERGRPIQRITQTA